MDGYLYVGVAICAALTASLATDDAATFIAPERLFWLRTGFGALGAGLLAAKMYRSTSYAQQQTEDKSDTKIETTTQIKQVSEIPPTNTKPVDPKTP